MSGLTLKGPLRPSPFPDLVNFPAPRQRQPGCQLPSRPAPPTIRGQSANAATAERHPRPLREAQRPQAAAAGIRYRRFIVVWRRYPNGDGRSPCGIEFGNIRIRGSTRAVGTRKKTSCWWTPKPKNFKLLSFNANGLPKNIPELTNCMSEYGIDIALIQETYLKPNRPRACAIAGYVQLRTDRTHARRGDHRPVLLKWSSRRREACFHRQNYRLEKSVDRVRKIDTPPLNSIADDISTIEQIDHAIGAFTSHVRTVVEKCEQEVPASSDRRKFPPDILELIRAKTQLAARAHILLLSIDPERALQREVKARV
ncbi:hypothetical protein EVAR_80951_1 [Eumeta japonica]|uniref:RNA-directed DNA polymerase from transposon BS n=1 Tax=Eumeta variegata TaxID=151549 RepID=A0A4C2AGI4_EUMVA|nr:hypothetical protein EVAR_80951_1 [Eumeta japonica]